MSVANEIMKSKPIDFTDPNNKHNRVLIVGDTKFYVNSGILSEWSDYFSVLFEGIFKEADDKEIELKDLDRKAVEQCLKIFYDNCFADFGDDLLVPLIEMSFFLLAPKVLDSCKSYIDKNLESISSNTIVDLLYKVCENDLTELKVKLVNYLKNDEVMDTFLHERVVTCANNYDLEDIKMWLGNYLFKKVTPGNCSNWLDYSVFKDLPTLKAAIIEKLPSWDLTKQQYANGHKPLVPEKNIIGLVESAFKHHVDILKIILRKRIHYMLKATGKYFNDNGTRYMSKNTFLENNLGKIYALPKEIREFIITSTIREEF